MIRWGWVLREALQMEFDGFIPWVLEEKRATLDELDVVFPQSTK